MEGYSFPLIMLISVLSYFLLLLYVIYTAYKTVKSNNYPTYLSKPLYWILWLIAVVLLCWLLNINIRLMIT